MFTIVQTAEGAVRGLKLKSVRNGVEYCSYRGIPYGKPPVGLLRFKPPVAVEAWTGVRDATKDGPPCFQIDPKTQKPQENSSEDCLILNVYTPKLPSVNTRASELKPVMFYLHGGGFKQGSSESNIYGPDFLVTEDIVLVTINYRLGPFGFLSLGNEKCPGNNGLKDMVLALKWVKRNIAVFGGNPDNVTIFGESAGGAAVHCLVLSQQTKGLYHKAIAQSGTAFSPWAFAQKPKERAFKLGEIMGCKTTDEDELLDFISRAKAIDLVEKDNQIINQLEPGEHHMYFAFVPCVEPDIEGAFLTKPPDEILASGDFNDVPFIQGVTDREGIFVLTDPNSIVEINTTEDAKHLIPSNWYLDLNSKKSTEIAQKLKDFYFNRGYDIERFVDAMTCIYFANGFYKSVEYMSKLPKRKSPSYLYQFSFDGRSFMKTIFQIKIKGSCHGDDILALFNGPLFLPPPEPGTKEHQFVEVFTRMWSNFAKYGDPTPEDHLWKAMTPEDRIFLDINDQLTLQKDMKKEEFELWRDLELFAKT